MEILFSGWAVIGRVLLVGVCGYIALLLLLRISGKRTLSKMNAFDLVVTVALGSTFGTLLLSREVALADGVVALAVLIGLQFAVSWLSVRWRPLSKGIKARPALLAHRGKLDHEALRRERVTPEEVFEALRREGVTELSQVGAIVMETTGDLSIIKGELPAQDIVANVKGLGGERSGGEDGGR